MTLNKQPLIEQIRKKIWNAQHIALFGHIRPDGDTLGALLGLGWALEDAGKHVQFICQDELPAFGWLTPEMVCRPTVISRTPAVFDCSILLDISSIDRAGAYFNTADAPHPDICIDHHISNPGIARLNWIEPEAPATSEIVARLLPWLDLTITPEIAQVLLSGMVMDTLGFSTSNTNAESLRTAALLMDHGADLYQITRKVLKAHSFEAGKLWAAGLARMDRSDGVVWTCLTLADRAAAGYTELDDASLIDYLAVTDQMQAALILSEQPNNRVKASWRSSPGVDVADVAASFGGGGHKQAAGADMPGILETVKKAVLERTVNAVCCFKNADEKVMKKVK